MVTNSKQSFVNHLILIVYLTLTSVFSISAYSENISVGSQNERVAIIFNGGDRDPYMNSYFNHDMAEAINFYKDAGFSRIEILTYQNDDPDHISNAQNLKKIISSIKGAQEIHVEFVSHGQSTVQDLRDGRYVDGASNLGSLGGIMFSPPKAQLTSGDVYTKLTPTEKELEGEVLNVRGGTLETKFEIWTNGSSPVRDASEDPKVYLRDLVDDVKIIQSNSPSTKLVIGGNSCFFGSVARALANTPNVQVFSSSRASIPAFTIPPIPTEGETPQSLGAKNKDYIQFLQSNLRSGLSYTDAQNKALTDYLDANATLNPISSSTTEDLSAISLPKTGMEEFIAQWCIDHQTKGNFPGASDSCRKPELLKPISDANHIGRSFYTTGPYVQACRENETELIDFDRLNKKIVKQALLKLRSDVSAFTNDKSYVRRNEEMIKKLNDKFRSAASTLPLTNLQSPNALHNFGPMLTRFPPFEQAKANLLSRINDYLEICVDGKASPDKSLNCDTSITLSPLLTGDGTFWSGKDPKVMERKVGDIVKKCGINFDTDLPTPAQRFANLICLTKEAKGDPLLEGQLSLEASRINNCPMIKTALKLVKEEEDCIKKFKAHADCLGWQRLQNLTDLGAQHLKFNVKLDNDSTNSGAAVK